jgi:hypothetical protein
LNRLTQPAECKSVKLINYMSGNFEIVNYVHSVLHVALLCKVIQVARR